MTSREKGWLAGLVILSIMAVVELFYLPGHSRLMQALNDMGHLPTFGVIAVAILHLVKMAWPSWRKQPKLAYGASLLLATGLGATSEILQYFTERDASLEDLGRDFLGAASFLALYAAIRDVDLKSVRRSSKQWRLRLLTLVAALWLVASWTLLTWSLAFVYRNRHFPELCNFDSWLSTRFLDPNLTRLQTGVNSDAVGMPARGTRMYFEGRDWPGVVVTDIYPNWGGYDSLILEVCVEGDHTLHIGLGVTDRRHNQEYSDRFNMGFSADPGLQRLGVGLGRVHMGPKNRELDMSRISTVRIFADSSAVGDSLLLTRLYLK